MGRKFWLRVAGGALVIFLIGFGLYTGARAAKREAASAITEFATEYGGKIPAALAGLKDSVAITLNGERLGRLRHLTLERSVSGELPELLALVELQDAGKAAQLASCNLTPVSSKDLHKFRCAAAGETGLEQVGLVTFKEQGIERPLMVNDSLAAELRKGEPYHVNLDLTEDVTASVRTADDGLVDIKADSHGARIVVNDQKGGKIVRIQADSTGVSVKVDSTR